MNELNLTEQKDPHKALKIQVVSSDAVYGLGLLGAWAYYLRNATTSREKVAGFFKGLFWPAFLVYALFESLNEDLT